MALDPELEDKLVTYQTEISQNGENYRGMEVSAYMWTSGADGRTAYAAHWSTGPSGAERLFSEYEVNDVIDQLLRDIDELREEIKSATD